MALREWALLVRMAIAHQNCHSPIEFWLIVHYTLVVFGTFKQTNQLYALSGYVSNKEAIRAIHRGPWGGERYGNKQSSIIQFANNKRCRGGFVVVTVVLVVVGVGWMCSLLSLSSVSNGLL